MNSIRVSWLFLKLGVLNELQYRVNFFVSLLQAAIALVTGLVVLALVYSHTEELNGWSKSELLCVLGVQILMGGAIRTYIQPNMTRLIEDVRDGKLSETRFEKSARSIIQSYQGEIDRQVKAEGCPLFMVYQAGSVELDTRLKTPEGLRKRFVSLKGMEHVKRSLENRVAQESLKLESGLILLAIAVSGGPFLGLLGTVWGVMSTFGHIAQQGSATLTAMAPTRCWT